MNYGNSTQNSAKEQSPSNGLVADAGGLTARLSSVLDRIVRLHGVLHGHQPRPVEGKGGVPPEDETIRRHLDWAHKIVTEIEDELQQIEQRL